MVNKMKSINEAINVVKTIFSDKNLVDFDVDYEFENVPEGLWK